MLTKSLIDAFDLDTVAKLEAMIPEIQFEKSSTLFLELI